jgi:hypothetical protein
MDGKKRRHDDDGDARSGEKWERLEWPLWVYEADSGNRLVPMRFAPIPIYRGPPAPVRGKIRVYKIYTRFARVKPRLLKWPTVEGYERYNVCKNNLYQELSPMLLGPVIVDGETYAHTIEDGWQCSKVWPSHLQGHPPESDAWLPAWTEWSRRGRMSGESRRHRIPKHDAGKVGHGNPNVPLFSYFRGRRLPYKEARREMYLPWYEELVQRTDAYRDLKARHLGGVNLLLLEFDGLDRDKEGDLTKERLLELIEDDSRPFGHGLALAATLMDFPVWRRREGGVYDSSS